MGIVDDNYISEKDREKFDEELMGLSLDEVKEFEQMLEEAFKDKPMPIIERSE